MQAMAQHILLQLTDVVDRVLDAKVLLLDEHIKQIFLP
jgi:hypothetical protein